MKKTKLYNKHNKKNKKNKRKCTINNIKTSNKEITCGGINDGLRVVYKYLTIIFVFISIGILLKMFLPSEYFNSGITVIKFLKGLLK